MRFLSFIFLLVAFLPVQAEITPTPPKWSKNILQFQLQGAYPQAARTMALGADGTLYISTSEGLYAVSPEGTIKWSLPMVVGTIPTVDKEGTIYNVSLVDGKLHAVSPEGKIKWIFQTGSGTYYNQAPTVAPDGTVYLVPGDGAVYAINSANGSLKWVTEAGLFDANVLVDYDGTLYAVGNMVCAINPNGTVKWKDAFYSNGGVLGADHTLYAVHTSSGDNLPSGLWAIQQGDGKIKWTVTFPDTSGDKFGSNIIAPPILDAAGNILVLVQYYNDNTVRLHRVTPQGEIQSSTPFPQNVMVSSNPILGKDGAIYLKVSKDNKSALSAFTAEGLKWLSTDIESVNFEDPLLGTEGTIYLGTMLQSTSVLNNSLSFILHAFQTNSGGLSPTPWPMLRANPQNTSVAPLPPATNFSVLPSKSAISKGQSATFTLQGGQPPYLFINAHPDSIVGTTLNGSQLLVKGLNVGTTTLTVSDSAKTTYTVEVQVLSAWHSPVGTLVDENLRIGAIVNVENQGPVEAQWQAGTSAMTQRGDKVMWGYFYVNSKDVSWGSLNNPEVFVKIWWDVSGRIDVNYFHVSVPHIAVYTDFTGKENYGAPTLSTFSTSTGTRYIRHYYFQDPSAPPGANNRFVERQFEEGQCPTRGSDDCWNFLATIPFKLTPIQDGVEIAAIIRTIEKGDIQAKWFEGGKDKTSRGDRVVWGYFYADPTDVNWGNPSNPEAFVKIWFDINGRIDVNFFHVSVPDIGVYRNDQSRSIKVWRRYMRLQ